VSVRGVGGRFVRRVTERISQSGDDASAIWDVLQLARHADRPYPLDYIGRLFTEFEEFHGDHLYGDDPAIVCGVARFQGEPVGVIGQQKGRDTQERTYRNFGMPSPEGYRKAMRVMTLAEKMGMPIITLIDTPGAFPGAGAETRGQGSAIAHSIQQMMRVTVPTIAVVIGEGSSGGALAIGVADRVMMLENATYSVISPEGGAAILWRDAGKARQAAAAFRPTAANCYRWGIIDAVVPEPTGGAHKDHDEAARILEGYLSRTLRELRGTSPVDRRRLRRERYRRIGNYREATPASLAAASGRPDPSTNGSSG
jgi:acetyl-CoA carboxylase carboxyl transferase subunit alpha